MNSNGLDKPLEPVRLLAYKMFSNAKVSGLYAWHLSVFVHNYEFTYGSDGLSVLKLTEKPDEEQLMGHTNVSGKEFVNFIKKAKKEWTPRNYDVLYHNCQCFVSQVLNFLGITTKIPDTYTELSKVAGIGFGLFLILTSFSIISPFPRMIPRRRLSPGFSKTGTGDFDDFVKSTEEEDDVDNLKKLSNVKLQEITNGRQCCF